MILELYLFIASLGFLFFMLSFYKQEQRLAFIALAFVMFFTSAMASGSIDTVACAYTTTWSCTTHNTAEMGGMIMFAMLGLLSLLYLLAYVFGYATEAADASGMG